MDEHPLPPPLPSDEPPVARPLDEYPTALPVEVAQPIHDHERTRRIALFWAILGVLGIAFGGLFAIGTRLGPERGDLAFRIAGAGLESLPFLILALLAYPGEHRSEFRILTFAYWLVLIGAVSLASLGLSFMGVIDAKVFEGINNHPAGARPSARNLLPGDAGPRLVLVAVGTLGAALLGLVAYLPSIRRIAARVLPIDPNSFVHGTALATVVAMTVAMAVPLLTLGDPPLLTFVNNFKGTEMVAKMSQENQALDNLYGLVWLVPCAILAVGFPLYRSFGAACGRIGLVWPSPLQIVFGLFAAVALVGLMNFAVDPAINKLWDHYHWPKTDVKAFEELMKAVINPVGAIAIGVSAGLGEELFTRGVLQPKLGILLSNMLFTMMHAFQYSWDGLASVFIIGLILGVIRKYSNTSTSAIVHGTYDFILIFGAYKGWFENV